MLDLFVYTAYPPTFVLVANYLELSAHSVGKTTY